jgi:M6 family metalloprotease-like protein
LQKQEERTNRRRLASAEGSLRNLVVLIRFADHVDRILPSPTDYDILLNGPGGSSIAPTGSVNDVFLTNSYGKFSLQSTVYPWITLSQPEAYYGDNKSGLGAKIFEAIREALGIIDSDPTFDISEFNTDYNQGDPYIDAITFIHSGYGAEFGGNDCYGTAASSRVWSHNWFMYDGAWTSSDGTVRVSDYHINPGLWGVCGSEISRIGVIAHETLHFLGLPDLYDPQGGNGIGDYCLMANSWGVDGTQRYPPILSAWSKIELGWIDNPISITEKGDYTLKQSWQYPEVYKIEMGYAPNEYLLIENRQPGSFDALLQYGGLAIWHIDENMYQYINTLEGYPGQLGWPANNNHYAVALLQADGRYDLEQGINYGDYGDLFRYDYFFGVDFLFPSTDHPSLGPFPNTDSYAQGVARTNVFISGISTAGPQMTFSLLSSPCQPNEVHFELTLLTDGKGNEASWTLFETFTNEVALSGDLHGNYSQYNVVECLPAKCYTFTIRDSGNDGLCCNYGTGGYSVRLNGLKLASGNEFGSRDETDLQCLAVPPTMMPTRAPTKPTNSPTLQPSVPPSVRPSTGPSLEPSSAPSGICGRQSGLLEITLEGGEFVEGVSWDVIDTFGETLLSEEVDNEGGLYTKEECIPLDACYTFAIRDAVDGLVLPKEEEHRVLYSVKLDGEMIASGSDFGAIQTTMFGNTCLGGNGDISCTETGGDTTPMSMFRLELASAERELSWTLLDESKQVILSAGPFGECNVNSQAICLPREACYEFIIQDEAGCCSYGNDVFTLLFTQTDDMIQNYTGSVSGDFTRVFLGSCYDYNFS